MKKITFIHLWNNYSGSPNVLSTVAEEMHKRGLDTTLITSFNNDGFLSEVECNKRINVSYRFEKNILLRLFQLIKFQLVCSVRVLQLDRNTLIYINTILPFLPALTAKMKGMTVIYHIHEAYPNKSIFNKICFQTVEFTAKKIICVSEYVKNHLTQKSRNKAIVVYNSLSDTFIRNKIEKKAHDLKTVLMISSTRRYKGIFDFCEIASKIPEFQFTLVCDAGKDEISQLFSGYLNIKNLMILPTSKDLHCYYASSDLIVNFSNPRLIIETFGLTILEGMHYGLPSIVPPVGGIAELVEDGKSGYKIDINDKEKIKNKIKELFRDESLYKLMSTNSSIRSKAYSLDIQADKIFKIIN